MPRPLLPVVILLCGLLAGSVLANTYRDSTFDAEALKPPSTAGRSKPVPKLDLILRHELPLRGPIVDPGPTPVDDAVEIRVDGGVWRVDWSGGSAPEPAVPAPPAPESGAGPELSQGFSPDGQIRVTALPDGWLLAEKSCRRCRDGWRRRWRLRVAGRTVSRPLVTEDRVFFGATDNRVYAVKRKNGHRVWGVDVDGRASRPPALWRGPVAGSEEGATMILIVPDHGAELLALDAASGQRVASFRLEEASGVLVGGAVASRDGRVAVARQSYVETEAALLLFDLLPTASKAEKGLAYNDAPTGGSDERSASRTEP